AVLSFRAIDVNRDALRLRLNLFHRLIPSHGILRFPPGIRKGLTPLIRKFGEAPSSKEPVVVLKHSVGYGNSVEHQALAPGLPATIDVVTTAVTSIDTVRMKFQQIGHVRKTGAVLRFHPSHEFGPSCTALPVPETNSYSLSHLRARYAWT